MLTVELEMCCKDVIVLERKKKKRAAVSKRFFGKTPAASASERPASTFLPEKSAMYGP